MPQRAGVKSFEAPQTFIHSLLDPIAAFYGKMAVRGSRLR